MRMADLNRDSLRRRTTSCEGVVFGAGVRVDSWRRDGETACLYMDGIQLGPWPRAVAVAALRNEKENEDCYSFQHSFYDLSELKGESHTATRYQESGRRPFRLDSLERKAALGGPAIFQLRLRTVLWDVGS